MKKVEIVLKKINDWDSFHDIFNEIFGFPDFYGNNMNAWIDCMSDISTEKTVGMTDMKISVGEDLLLVLRCVEDFQKQHKEIFNELTDAISFINEERMDLAEAGKLLLLLA